MKRLFSFLMAVCLSVSLLGTDAYAEDALHDHEEEHEHSRNESEEVQRTQDMLMKQYTPALLLRNGWLKKQAVTPTIQHGGTLPRMKSSVWSLIRSTSTLPMTEWFN